MLPPSYSSWDVKRLGHAHRRRMAAVSYWRMLESATARYQSIDGVRLPKIGLGTWGIGGDSNPDRTRHERSRNALRSALEAGYRHFDTAEMYASGHCEQLIGAAIAESGIPREAIFLNSKVNPEHLEFRAFMRSVDRSLRRLGVEYMDLYLVHWPIPRVAVADSFRILNRVVREG